jgi:hypothetical protein
MAVAAGYGQSIALKNDGTVACWGDNTYGQTNPPANLALIKLIAAGYSHTLVGLFSPLVQYSVDVTKDLLLLYNSTSTNSIVVKDYYLAHRPMVGGANTLGISCPTNEVVELATFTNQILSHVLQWLTNNPTKHPQYLILFPDIPSTVTNTDGIALNSVAYGLSTNVLGIQPFVTSINMGLFDATNDCIHYIDKLSAFGTNGQLIISAGAGGYSNTNYVLDDIRHGTGYGIPGADLDYTVFGGTVSAATNALLAASVPQNAIHFFDGLETLTNGVQYNLTHPTGITNLSGYMCWGAHSSLSSTYPTNGNVAWSGNSGWWIIETAESYNGQRENDSSGQAFFLQWFSANAFGGSSYSSTPVGGVSHTHEPGLEHLNDSGLYFGLWAGGKNFAMCAWNSRGTPHFQAVGDPLVRK